jgi:hypothetical protein
MPRLVIAKYTAQWPAERLPCRVIVSDLIADDPELSGMTWRYLQYILGFGGFGHNVYYLESRASGYIPAMALAESPSKTQNPIFVTSLLRCDRSAMNAGAAELLVNGSVSHEDPSVSSSVAAVELWKGTLLALRLQAISRDHFSDKAFLQGLIDINVARRHLR